MNTLKSYIEANEWDRAIKLCARFPVLGEQSDAIRTASDAIFNPGFYKQIKLNPEKLIEKGIAAIKERYKF